MSRRLVQVAAALLLAGTPAAADTVLDWNVTMLATLGGGPPFSIARYAATTQLAVFEAVNAITGDYEPYVGTIVAPPGASSDAAAAAAAHAVLTHYFPAKAAALDAALAASLATIPDGTAKADGIAVGQAAAAAMIALRVNDGSAPPTNYLPTSTAPGQWQPTGPPTGLCAALGGAFLNWGSVRPFGVPNVQEFRPGPPPPLNSGTYSRDYAEVKAVGAIDSALRPQDRTDVAIMFGAGLSPVTWANWVARQVATAQDRSMSENARAFALLNMALSDASVAVFDTKYYYAAWRPETAIHLAATDGNAKTEADVTFESFVAAPCFPGYPSAHGTLSSAAREVLERLYGPVGHDITLTAASVPGVTLSYSSFKAIVADVDDARVYGGIHFRFDQEAGGQQGQSIGAYVYKHNLRPIHP